MGEPAIIEVAITPLRWGAPVMTVDQMVAEASACIDAGAGIVHHHHDMRLAEAEAIEQLVATGSGIQAAYPGMLVYTDYLAGKTAAEENRHLQPALEAGALTMFAIDPGLTTFALFDDQGAPTRTYTDGLRFSECHELVEFSKQAGVPISLGVFEPGHLRWILAYEKTCGFSPGTVIKLYFGGAHAVDRPGARSINFGLPPTPAALDVYRDMMRESRLPWVVSLFGDPILDSALARSTLECGGHLRVGIEDAANMSSLGNRDMVEQAVELARSVGRSVVSGSAARSVLCGD